MGEILKNIGAAFVGGLILNVMPCVLPVLTMKVFHVIKKADADPRENRAHGVAYAAGVVVTFLAFAAIIIALRAAIGLKMQWGQQYSKPGFLAAVVAMMYVFGLNALGVFEITIGMSGGDSRTGHFGSFVNGIVASIMSTPCSAPFLGAAATYALSANSVWWQTLTMFFFIGVGLAFPFVLISFVPAASKILPKPGEWMESFKQLMGFTLMGAAIFYYGSLQKQLSSDAANSFLFFLLALGVALWATQKFGGFEHSSARRWTVRGLAVALTVGMGFWLLDFKRPPKPAAVASKDPVGGDTAPNGAATGAAADLDPEVKDGKINWAQFEDARLKAELARGRAVFIDFTADWCMNCKTNERLFIEVEQIRADLQKGRILPMKVDLTTDEAQDEMKPWMEKLGRAAIPIYVVYYPDGAYDLLPETITTSMLSEALTKATKKFPPDGIKPLGRAASAKPAGPDTKTTMNP
jgi:thiol:disulfide interchange protein DsbD